MPAEHEKSTGVCQSTINILELHEGDFSENLAKKHIEDANSANSAAAYDKATREKKIAKVQKEQQVNNCDRNLRGTLPD